MTFQVSWSGYLKCRLLTMPYLCWPAPSKRVQTCWYQGWDSNRNSDRDSEHVDRKGRMEFSIELRFAMFAPPRIVCSSSLPWECGLSLHFLLLLEISFPNSFFEVLTMVFTIFFTQWYCLALAHERQPVAKPHHGHFVPHLKILACCFFSRVLRAEKIVYKSLARGGEPRRRCCAPSAIASYQRRLSFSISREELRRISRRSTAWLAALRHQRLGGRQRHIMWRTKHRKDTVRDHAVQTCLH